MGEQAQRVFDAAYANGSDTYVSNAPDAKYFDVLGFDPRGVNNTTPFLSCFSNPGDQVSWALKGNQLVFGSPETDFNYLWQRWVTIGEACPKQNKIADFMSTAVVVRDMIEIVERHAEWLKKQSGPCHEPGEAPIQFWGISYGSLLGTTAAAMQPHRVKRFLLDGVLDSHSYYSGELKQNIVDGDRIMERFFQYCSEAGEKTCPFAAGSVHETRARLDEILLNVTVNGPIAVPDAGGHGPSMVTLSNIKNLIRGFLYFPPYTFPAMASLLSPLSSRNGTLIATTDLEARPVFTPGPPPADTPIDSNDPSTETHSWALAAVPPIGVAGGEVVLHRDRTQFHEYLNQLRHESKYTADAWATIWVGLSTWAARAKWVYGDTNPIASKDTAHPILFANNILDPVTPLVSAQSMHSQFPGSGLIINDGEGHTTLSSPSFCIAQAYREYFQSGRLPDRSSPCLPNQRPFLGASGPRVAPLPTNLTKEEKFLHHAFSHLAGALAKLG